MGPRHGGEPHWHENGRPATKYRPDRIEKLHFYQSFDRTRDRPKSSETVRRFAGPPFPSGWGAGRAGKINVKTCPGRGHAMPPIAAPAGARKTGTMCLST